MTSHDLNQWWLILLTHIWVTWFLWWVDSIDCNNIAADTCGHRGLNKMATFFMMTSSNGNIFRVTGHLWGEPPSIAFYHGTPWQIRYCEDHIEQIHEHYNNIVKVWFSRIKTTVFPCPVYCWNHRKYLAHWSPINEYMYPFINYNSAQLLIHL